LQTRSNPSVRPSHTSRAFLLFFFFFFFETMCIICDPARKEEMETATVILCSGCPHVARIPVLPRLQYLDCAGCSSLTTISVLPNLTYLYCYKCPSLVALPVLPNLFTLWSYGCPSLVALPEIPNLTALRCDKWIDHSLNPRFPAVQKAARTLERRRLKKLRYTRFKKFISTPQYSAYLNAPGHVGHRIETAQLRKLGSERT